MSTCGLKLDTEDVDRMHYLLERYAFPLTHRVPVVYNGVVLRVYTHGVHPGYARLIEDGIGKEYKTPHKSYDLDHYTEIRGPAQRYQRLADLKENLKQDDDMVVLKTLVAIVYNVPAVHSPY